MVLSSSAFNDMETIPAKYTCEGMDINPPLYIDSVPKGTVSIAIIMDDHDAPAGTFTHWIVWNIMPENNKIEENLSHEYEGTNDFGKTGYGGPCPPYNSVHTYYFRAYALNTELNLEKGSSREVLERSMEGHVIGYSELRGRFGR
jgi:Raf kinase inhibitor-like YbhB/YbcL family protein